jgi:hypothetical protein
VPVDAPWAAAKASQYDAQTLLSWLEQNSVTPQFRQLATTACEPIFGSESRELSLLYVLFYIASSGNETNPGTFERNFNTRQGAQQWRFQGGSQLIPLKIAADLGASRRCGAHPARRRRPPAVADRPAARRRRVRHHRHRALRRPQHARRRPAARGRHERRQPITGRLFEVAIGPDGKPGAPTQLWESQPVDGARRLCHRPVGQRLRRATRRQPGRRCRARRDRARAPPGRSRRANGSPVPFDAPSSVRFLGTRLIVANQSYFTGDPTHHEDPRRRSRRGGPAGVHPDRTAPAGRGDASEAEASPASKAPSAPPPPLTPDA